MGRDAWLWQSSPRQKAAACGSLKEAYHPWRCVWRRRSSTLRWCRKRKRSVKRLACNACVFDISMIVAVFSVLRCHARTHMHAPSHTHTHAHTHARMHACTHKCMHTHMLTSTHAYACTHHKMFFLIILLHIIIYNIFGKYWT